MAAIVNINGQIVDQDHAFISVFDHGFLYGEGIYETLRTYRGEPFLFARHMRRLRRSAEMIHLPIPLTDDENAQRFAETQRAAHLMGATPETEAYIRILITRGVGELTYDPSATPHSSAVIIVKPHVQLSEEVYNAGVAVSIVPIVRNHPATVNPLIKSNNLLNNALAAQHAVREKAFEGVGGGDQKGEEADRDHRLHADRHPRHRPGDDRRPAGVPRRQGQPGVHRYRCGLDRRAAVGGHGLAGLPRRAGPQDAHQHGDPLVLGAAGRPDHRRPRHRRRRRHRPPRRGAGDRRSARDQRSSPRTSTSASWRCAVSSARSATHG